MVVGEFKFKYLKHVDIFNYNMYIYSQNLCGLQEVNHEDLTWRVPE